MGFLFIISGAALLALLWAAFSMARHIRRARRRQRNAVQALAQVKREAMAASPGNTETLGGETAGKNSAGPSKVESGSPRDWTQMRYTSSTFTAERALTRKV